MSPNILLDVKQRLKSSQILDDQQIEKIIKNMETWYKNKIIYPSQIKSLLLLDYSDVYKILDIIKEMGILKYNYEVYCTQCEKFVDTYLLNSLRDFPEGLCCDSGKHKLSPTKDAILIFKVI